MSAITMIFDRMSAKHVGYHQQNFIFAAGLAISESNERFNMTADIGGGRVFDCWTSGNYMVPIKASSLSEEGVKLVKLLCGGWVKYPGQMRGVKKETSIELFRMSMGKCLEFYGVDVVRVAQLLSPDYASLFMRMMSGEMDKTVGGPYIGTWA